MRGQGRELASARRGITRTLAKLEKRLAGAEAAIAKTNERLIALASATAYGTNGRSLISMVSHIHKKVGAR